MTLSAESRAIAASLHGHGPGDLDELGKVEAHFGFRLPDDYREFVSINDGTEGFAGDGYMSLWRVSELVELNELSRMAEFARGLTVLGTDGGTEFFGLDRRNDQMVFVKVPVVFAGWEYAEAFGRTFEEFLRTLRGTAKKPASPGHGGFGFGRKQEPKANPELLGKNVWQIQPVILGGSPTDPKNRMVVPLRDMLKFADFWTEQVVQMKGSTRTITIPDSLRTNNPAEVRPTSKKV